MTETLRKREPRPGEGRPSSYKPEYAEQARKLCNLGATDADLADFFEVSSRTIPRWAAAHDEFCQALKVGKDVADARVERSLYHRAIGYTYDAVKIFPPKSEGKPPIIVPYQEHVPPDSTSCIFWLKNRKQDEWRDKQETTSENKSEIVIRGGLPAKGEVADGEK
jgi:hypothetical protein